MLNHPGEQLIFQADFLYMVEKVDICIEFLRARRHYKESEVYLLRFHQCLTRAMTLVKMNFVGSLRALSADTSKRLSDTTATLSQTAVMHLLYTRFDTVANKVAPLVRELERRARKYPDDLGSLLAECHSAYFSVRKALLVPKVLEEIRGLDPARSELVELVSCASSARVMLTDVLARRALGVATSNSCVPMSSIYTASSSVRPKISYSMSTSDAIASP